MAINGLKLAGISNNASADANKYCDDYIHRAVMTKGVARTGLTFFYWPPEGDLSS